MIILPAGQIPTNKVLQRMRGLSERRWNPHIRKYAPRYRNAIIKQSGQAVRVLTERGIVPGIEEMAVLAIGEEPIRRVLVENYNDTATRFFDITRRLKVGKKDLSETLFYQELARFIIVTRGEQIKQITQTTKEDVKWIIAAAVLEGLGIEETARLIRRETAIKARARSLTIARTETIGAANYGQQKGAEATGLGLKKIWVASVDGREREWHREANRSEAGLTESFTVGGEEMEYPHSAGASARNVINCRCSVVYQEA